MAKAIEQAKGGLTAGHSGFGDHGAGVGRWPRFAPVPPRGRPRRSARWIGFAALVAVSACKPPSPSPAHPPVAPVVNSVPAEFALVARAPSSESRALESLLAEQVLPSIVRSRRVRYVNTYSARDGDAVLYVVFVSMTKPGPHSPNVAFEILADGRSFEDARALQEQVRRYFRVAPVLAEHRAELSVQRSAAFRVAKAPEEK